MSCCSLLQIKSDDFTSDILPNAAV